MRLFLFTLLLFPLALLAQEDERYLEGAVNVVDGKVCFSRNIDAPSMSKTEIYRKLLKWGEKNYNSKTSRVAYKNEEKGEIGILAEVPSNTLDLDETTMRCRIAIEVKDMMCKLTITNIKYEYNVPYQKEPERYDAEDWITDEYGLSRDKTKLNRVSGGFRRATIDYADRVFNSAYEFLDDNNNRKHEYGKVARPLSKDETADNKESSLIDGVKSKMAPTNTVIRMEANDFIIVTEADGKVIESAQWKGMGELAGRKIVVLSMQKGKATNGIANDEVIQISLVKKGEPDDKPRATIKCHKIGATSNSTESLFIGEIDEQMSK